MQLVGLTLTFFIIYFMQANIFTWFNIAGVKPNLFIVFILVIGLFVGNKLGFIFGIIFGIYIDLLIGKSIGITGMMLAIIGLVGEYLDKNFSKDNRVTLILMVMGSTIICELGSYIFNIWKWNTAFELFPLIKTLTIEVIFNAVLVIILYPFIRKAGNALEKLFKNKPILTRYY